MATDKNEGVCRFCLQTFSGSSIGRHLVKCKVKKEKNDEEAVAKKVKHSIYHLKIWGYKPYWLHIEMKSTDTLGDLDQFLRKTWLECCGHLSEFTINGINYSSSGGEGDFWGMEPSESMDIPLMNALDVKSKFKYVYDFGSSTNLEGQVVAERQGVLKETARILARNTPPEYDCDECDARATHFCTECETLYCDKCLEKHECGDEMALPVVNSPRFAVCGYEGEMDDDDFDIDA